MNVLYSLGAPLYTNAWVAAPRATEAPVGDRRLWIGLGKYESIDSEISIAARKVLESHLWYLSQATIFLNDYTKVSKVSGPSRKRKPKAISDKTLQI